MQWEDKLKGYPTKVSTELAKRLRSEQERFNIPKSSKANGLQDKAPKEQLTSQQPSEEGQSRLR
jgi:hypothetical protein